MSVSTCNWPSRAAMVSPACPPPTPRTVGSRSVYAADVIRSSSQLGPWKSRIDLALWTPTAGPFFVSLDLFEHRQQRPGFERTTAGNLRNEAQHAAAAAFGGFKAENGFDRRRA